MNKTLIIILIILMISLPLLGFNLADPEIEIEAEFNDNLVGVYITTEYINLFDFETYMKDNFNGSSNIQIDENDTKKYTDRMYGTYEEETHSFSFNEVEGILFGSIPIEEDCGLCYYSNGGTEICDGHTNISSSDESDKLELKGTVYIFPKIDSIIYINPVYQDKNGNIYLISGTGMASNDAYNTEGVFMSQKITNDITIEIEGKSKTQSTEITISIGIKYETRKVNILEYDINGKNIKTSCYLPEDMPKDFSVSDKTEYIIVESVKDNITTRELIQKNDLMITIFLLGSDGFFEQQSTKIIW